MHDRFSMLRSAFAPLREMAGTIKDYDMETFFADGMAGLTVAVVELPQAMAYALIAGVPAEYGIFTSIVQGMLGSMMASNDLLATGPTNTQSLLIAATVSRVVAQSSPHAGPALYLKLVIGLTMIKGLIQILFATARMGGMVRYVSRSVVIGFTAGAGVLIAIGQLPNFLGLSKGGGGTSLPGLLGSVQYLFDHVFEINLYPLLLGAVLLAGLIMLRRWYPRLPGPLIVVVMGAAAVAAMGWTGGQLALLGKLPASLPRPALPSITLDQGEALLTGALALAMLGMIETVGIGKSVAMKTGQEINPNREFMAQGVANLTGSFFQNIPGSGSFTRTALNQMAGARTRLAGVYNSAIIAVLFLAFGSQARFIPLTALAVVLFVVAYGLVDWKEIMRTLRTSRGEALVCLGTFAAVLLLPLSYAIFVGVILSISLYLRCVGQLQVAELVHTDEGQFIERAVERSRHHVRPPMAFLQVQGDLFFGVAHELRDRLLSLETQGAMVIILRLKRCPSVDATTLTMLERTIDDIGERGVKVILCGVQPRVYEQLRRFGLVDRLGERQVIAASPGNFASAKQAIRLGRKLLGHDPAAHLPRFASADVEYVI